MTSVQSKQQSPSELREQLEDKLYTWVYERPAQRFLATCAALSVTASIALAVKECRTFLPLIQNPLIQNSAGAIVVGALAVETIVATNALGAVAAFIGLRMARNIIFPGKDRQRAEAIVSARITEGTITNFAQAKADFRLELKRLKIGNKLNEPQAAA
jgi:hypothetical protein